MTVSIPDDIDPADYESVSAFKAAVYDEGGAGTWLDDMKLEIVYRDAHDIELEDHHKKLVTDDEEDDDAN